MIELALIAPVLALCVIGIVDMSNAYSRKLAIEQGAQRAIEKVMQTTGTDTVENTIAAEAVCQVDGVNTNGTCKTTPITTSNVTVTWRLDCISSGGTLTSYTSTTSATYDTYSCPSGTARQATYIQASIRDVYTPMFPVNFSGYSSTDGGYVITATAGMRTS